MKEDTNYDIGDPNRYVPEFYSRGLPVGMNHYPPMPKVKLPKNNGDRICNTCSKEDVCMYKGECAQVAKEITQISESVNVLIETDIKCKKWVGKVNKITQQNETFMRKEKMLMKDTKLGLVKKSKVVVTDENITITLDNKDLAYLLKNSPNNFSETYVRRGMNREFAEYVANQLINSEDPDTGDCLLISTLEQTFEQATDECLDCLKMNEDY